MNTSTVELDKTARTCQTAAYQRAEYIARLGSKKILELCVGPSLKTLELEYSRLDIECWGNDIDKRWAKYYPRGKWILGDALNIDYNQFDTVIFAPPLSKGCSGKRADALSPLSVNPSYFSFLQSFSKSNINKAIMVLPGRSLSTKQDRTETHFIMNKASEFGIVQWRSLVVKGTLKYLDLEISKL